jgi:methanogenic corrinoid protein MtbC1
MYTIKRAAEITGLPVATLRAWERRYAVVRPERTSGGYRLYDDRALADLVTMNALVEQGWTASQAADEVARRRMITDDTDPNAGLHRPPLPVAEPELVDEFIEAAKALDPAALAQTLDVAFSRGSIESVTTGWLLPTLTALGDAWVHGTVSIAGEHLASHAILRRLSTAYEAAGTPRTGPHIVVGLPEGSHHELGALAFATIARREGAVVLYLGANLPPQEWVTAVQLHEAEAAVIAVPSKGDVHAASRTARALAAAQPGLVIGIGGFEQEAVTGPGRKLGHDLVAAAHGLVDELTDQQGQRQASESSETA